MMNTYFSHFDNSNITLQGFISIVKSFKITKREDNKQKTNYDNIYNDFFRKKFTMYNIVHAITVKTKKEHMNRFYINNN